MNLIKPSLKDLIVGRELVLLGDDHNTDQGRVWLKKELPPLSGGIGFLATEYIESDRTDLLTGSSENKLHAYLKNRYKEFTGFDPVSITSLVKQCHGLGIETVGVDMPESSFSDWRASESQQERTKYISGMLSKLAS